MRNVAKYAPAMLEPPPDARHDWQIMLELIVRLGAKSTAGRRVWRAVQRLYRSLYHASRKIKNIQDDIADGVSYGLAPTVDVVSDFSYTTDPRSPRPVLWSIGAVLTVTYAMAIGAEQVSIARVLLLGGIIAYTWFANLYK